MLKMGQKRGIYGISEQITPLKKVSVFNNFSAKEKIKKNKKSRKQKALKISTA